MGKIADKLTYLDDTKQAIKTEANRLLSAQGKTEIADSDAFRAYADKLAMVEAGGSSSQEPRKFLNFNRTDTEVEVNAAAASVSNKQQLSVEAMVWIDDVYSADGDYAEIFCSGLLSGAVVPSIQLRQNDTPDNFVFGYSPEPSLNFTTAFYSSDGSPVQSIKQRWVHIVGVLDDVAGFIRLYHAGQLVAESTSAGPTSTMDAAAIGSRNGIGDRYFSGHIARVSLWDAALSHAEIAALATSTPDTRDPRLMHYWELDTGTNTVPDLVGNANGTVNGGAEWITSGIPGYL
ncbi:LamG-like jellyroll fold domain-containing protein [Halomonas alkaliantarctica]|uniref:LamG-like jellyroll fold domain-containing protein n=1 Tax=Halomonas alkaliantarctica TaxID=232346 RepID=UPI00265818BB|nr:LamG-like jellyroll fold domain-containing protein [Halomonas alkaliantarctica]